MIACMIWITKWTVHAINAPNHIPHTSELFIRLVAMQRMIHTINSSKTANANPTVLKSFDNLWNLGYLWLIKAEFLFSHTLAHMISSISWKIKIIGKSQRYSFMHTSPNLSKSLQLEWFFYLIIANFIRFFYLLMPHSLSKNHEKKNSPTIHI